MSGHGAAGQTGRVLKLNACLAFGSGVCVCVCVCVGWGWGKRAGTGGLGVVVGGMTTMFELLRDISDNALVTYHQVSLALRSVWRYTTPAGERALLLS